MPRAPVPPACMTAHGLWTRGWTTVNTDLRAHVAPANAFCQRPDCRPHSSPVNPSSRRGATRPESTRYLRLQRLQAKTRFELCNPLCERGLLPEHPSGQRPRGQGVAKVLASAVPPNVVCAPCIVVVLREVLIACMRTMTANMLKGGCGSHVAHADPAMIFDPRRNDVS